MLQRKARPELAEWLAAGEVTPAFSESLEALMELNGGADVLSEARRRLPAADPRICSALDELEAIASALERRFPLLPIHFDLAELRGYHYQTGMVFAAFVPGYGRELARGGRYDDIGRVFGHARPATGFSADLRQLLRLGAPMAECVGGPAGTVYAPSLDDDSLDREIRRLRGEGRVVIRELPGQNASATEMGCTQQLTPVDGEWLLTAVPSREAKP
jgi:ATP phosphoribosyltransferase regulatory subunit